MQEPVGVSVEKQRLIPSIIDNLTAKLAHLQDVTQILQGRLNSISHVSPSQPTSTPPKEKRLYDVEMAGHLDDALNSVDGLIAQVESILSRLEV